MSSSIEVHFLLEKSPAASLTDVFATIPAAFLAYRSASHTTDRAFWPKVLGPRCNLQSTPKTFGDQTNKQTLVICFDDFLDSWVLTQKNQKALQGFTPFPTNRPKPPHVERLKVETLVRLRCRRLWSEEIPLGNDHISHQAEKGQSSSNIPWDGDMYGYVI